MRTELATADEIPTPEAAANPLPPIVDACDFLATPLEEPKQIVQGLLHQGSKLVLGGGSKSFKTWTLLDLALSVAHGKRWLNFDTTKAKVLYVNFEIQDFPWQKRLQAVAKAKGIQMEPEAVKLWNLRGRAANYLTLLPQMEEVIKDQSYGLVLLDPAYKLYGGADENSASDVAGLLNGLEALAVNTGAAVAFGAHFSKGNQAGKESIDRISGSGVFARDPDAILSMTRHEQDGAFTVEATLRNFPQVEPFVVQWNYPLMDVSDLDPSKLKQAKGRGKTYDAGELWDLLPDTGLTTTEWETEAKQIGIKERTFYRLTKELRDADKVLQSKIDRKWKPIRKK